MARSIAQRINGLYQAPGGAKLVLKEPQELIQTDVAAVIGLDGRKMSKSYHNSIPLFATSAELKKYINRVTTDSLPPEAPKDPDASFLFKFYELFGSKAEVSVLRERYQSGIGWGEVKQILHEKADQHFSPMREKYNSLMSNTGALDEILQAGAAKASIDARIVLKRVKSALMGN
jgi:tryptophanyl-tRNA synthetase